MPLRACLFVQEGITVAQSQGQGMVFAKFAGTFLISLILLCIAFWCLKQPGDAVNKLAYTIFGAIIGYWLK